MRVRTAGVPPFPEQGADRPHLEQLFSSGSTRLIKGVKGKKGASLVGAVAFDADFNLKLSFPQAQGREGEIVPLPFQIKGKGSENRQFPPARSGLAGFGENHPHRSGSGIFPEKLARGGGPLSGP